MKTHTLKVIVLSVFMIISLMFINWKTIIDDKVPKKSKINELTRDEIKDGWRLLFDGKTFNGWRGLGRDHVPYGTWVIENGLIKKVNTGDIKVLADGRSIENGDLITDGIFENFELSFEWKINKAGNSGLKYNVSEEMCQEYGSKFSALGFEYQLLDDGDVLYKRILKPAQFSGSLYDLIPAKNIVLLPIGQFNKSRILVNGDHAEHWLNGIKVVEYEFGSKELDEAYKLSKFSKIKGFTDKRKAHIVLQNHNDESWFRNIKIRELK
jgi:hypothetical protein